MREGRRRIAFAQRELRQGSQRTAFDHPVAQLAVETQRCFQMLAGLGVGTEAQVADADVDERHRFAAPVPRLAAAGEHRQIVAQACRLVAQLSAAQSDMALAMRLCATGDPRAFARTRPASAMARPAAGSPRKASAWASRCIARSAMSSAPARSASSRARRASRAEHGQSLMRSALSQCRQAAASDAKPPWRAGGASSRVSASRCNTSRSELCSSRLPWNSCVDSRTSARRQRKRRSSGRSRSPRRAIALETRSVAASCAKRSAARSAARA